MSKPLVCRWCGSSPLMGECFDALDSPNSWPCQAAVVDPQKGDNFAKRPLPSMKELVQRDIEKVKAMPDIESIAEKLFDVFAKSHLDDHNCDVGFWEDLMDSERDGWRAVARHVVEMH